MKTKTFLLVPAIFIFLVSLLLVQPVSAHGGEPRVEINPDRLNPGAVLDLRGVDFEFEEIIALTLVGAQGEVSLGTVLADAEGIFVLSITLPADLGEGSYTVRATTDDHVVDSAPLTIWGSADLGGGSDGPREEEDSLIAPMPSSIPSVPTPVFDSATAIPSNTLPESELAQNITTPLVWLAIGIGVMILLVLSIRSKR